ncbi:MAG: YIP1 family protein [Burkholderiales bacterium]|nr:YIP1 family protein [Burkholderiales bacterium]
MNLIQRATNITLNPKAEWPIIADEVTTAPELYKSYVVPLSVIPVVASFIGMSVVGMSVPFMGNVRIPFFTGLITMILSFGMGLLSIYLISLIINALAPNFGSEKNAMQALRLTAYSFTPAWIAGILNLLPSLGMLGVLAGLYSIYVLYLGMPVLMKTPKEKAAGYTAVTVICSIVLMFLVMALVGSLGGMSAYRGLGMHMGSRSVETDGALGELAKIGKNMEAAGKKMEAAKQSGDTQGQVNAATEAIGAALGGDNQAEVVDKDKLKSLLPETLAGLKRTSFQGEKSAMGGFKISKAEAQYSDDSNRHMTLTLTDTGGSKMFGAMFAWGLMEQEKESDNGYEKMGKADGRPMHERFQKDSGSGEYSVLVAGRFLVECRGQNVDMASIKAAVNAIGFANLEAMKNEGVKK